MAFEMPRKRILDLSEKLQDRAVDEVKKTLEQIVQDNLEALFQILAAQHGLSDTWASKKSAIANEIIGALVRPMAYNMPIKIPAELTETEQAAIKQSLEEWARQHTFRTVAHCLEAVNSRLIELALP